jgi:hypothetical protein
MERAMQFREGSQASAAFVGVGGMCGWNSFLNLSAATFSFTAVLDLQLYPLSIFSSTARHLRPAARRHARDLHAACWIEQAAKLTPSK